MQESPLAGRARATTAIITNPRVLRGPNANQWRHAEAILRQRGSICAEWETANDGTNADRVARLIRKTRPDTIIAAGGDGTVSEVAHGIMLACVPTAPALAIIPLGTANNVARSLSLRSVRHDGDAAIDLAVTTALSGAMRRIDLGEVSVGGGDPRYFVGSLAIGMDADILHLRNRLRQRLHLTGSIGGYPLYLWSCAVNLVTRRHGGAARLRMDGQTSACRVYNLLVTNAPLYAGEFRFDAANSCDDGRLDLHLFRGPFDYVRQFVAAWRRHVHYEGGCGVEGSVGLRRASDVAVEFESPMASQLDGEEFVRAAVFRIRAVPQALSVRVADCAV